MSENDDTQPMSGQDPHGIPRTPDEGVPQAPAPEAPAADDLPEILTGEEIQLEPDSPETDFIGNATDPVETGFVEPVDAAAQAPDRGQWPEPVDASRPADDTPAAPWYEAPASDMPEATEPPAEPISDAALANAEILTDGPDAAVPDSPSDAEEPPVAESPEEAPPAASAIPPLPEAAPAPDPAPIATGAPERTDVPVAERDVLAGRMDREPIQPTQGDWTMTTGEVAEAAAQPPAAEVSPERQSLWEKNAAAEGDAPTAATPDAPTDVVDSELANAGILTDGPDAEAAAPAGDNAYAPDSTFPAASPAAADAPTITAPVVAEDTATTQTWHSPTATAEQRIDAADQTFEDQLFEGASVVPVVKSRVGAHIWGLLLTIIAVPLTWYAIADAGARFTLAPGNAVSTGVINPAAILELLGGIVGIVLIVELAKRSSLGATVMGVLTTLVGIPWVAVPAMVTDKVVPQLESLAARSPFLGNLSHHLQDSGFSGRLLVLGVVLLGIGLLSHSVRRRGRAEEALRQQVEHYNPDGAHLSARDRRRARKGAQENN